MTRCIFIIVLAAEHINSVEEIPVLDEARIEKKEQAATDNDEQYRPPYQVGGLNQKRVEGLQATRSRI